MEQLTLFPEDSLASLTVLPGSEKARKMTATSGRKCLGSSRNLDPLGSLVKTLLTSQTWNSTARYLTWKVQVTKANRLLYRLVPSTPNIEEIEHSLWPTPTVHGNYNKKGASKNSGIGLATAVKLFPTPTARDWKGRTGPNWNHQTLPDAVLWPTPRTKGMCGGTGSFQTMIDLQEKGVITEEERKQMTAGNGGQLNPTWVEWLMGFPIGWTELKD
ncbi:hypothetical protein J36TS2_14730 [Bacillus paralicheniformis]|nr:hypothetical protein BaLi_c06840 [Bacillus paralicheniformis ATCC 9945a]GIN52579.1 hypothetical protein J36TS2_14730 [Bacillus paralicheniformis]